VASRTKPTRFWLRSARQAHPCIPAARSARALPSITLRYRGCRECRVLQPAPTASRGVKEAHEQVTTGRAEITGIPCANGFNGFLRALPGEPGFFATVACEGGHRLCKLDTSVGMSGPHDFAVRAQRHSSFRRRPRPSHPASRFVTIAHTPLLPRRDGASFGFDLPDGTSRIFFARGLDDPNHVDKSREMGVYAQGIFAPQGVLPAAPRASKRELICPTTSKSFRFLLIVGEGGSNERSEFESGERGCLQEIKTPHPPSLREGTFSHKGRRKKAPLDVRLHRQPSAQRIGSAMAKRDDDEPSGGDGW
jgi:hypothetical protein